MLIKVYEFLNCGFVIDIFTISFLSNTFNSSFEYSFILFLLIFGREFRAIELPISIYKCFTKGA